MKHFFLASNLLAALTTSATDVHMAQLICTLLHLIFSRICNIQATLFSHWLQFSLNQAPPFLLAIIVLVLWQLSSLQIQIEIRWQHINIVGDPCIF